MTSLWHCHVVGVDDTVVVGVVVVVGTAVVDDVADAGWGGIVRIDVVGFVGDNMGVVVVVVDIVVVSVDKAVLFEGVCIVVEVVDQVVEAAVVVAACHQKRCGLMDDCLLKQTQNKFLEISGRI